MRALIATVDLSVAASVKATLATENLICDTTDLGDDCRKIGKLCDYDIILFDLQLRDSGYEVLRWLRMANVQTPILILSGLPELGHKITALGFSVDDCLTKPFDGRELVRRIQAIVQRSKDHSESIRPQACGQLTPKSSSRGPAGAPHWQGVQHSRAAQPEKGHDLI
jgi:two-component system cell cycle response regulator CtrA